MDVSLTAEQQAWRAAVDDLADALAVTPATALPAPDSAADWAAAVDLGLTSLRSRADTGGQPTGVEAALAVEAFAGRLCALPALGQALIAVELLDAAGAHDLLSDVVAGRVRIAPTVAQDLVGFGVSGSPAVAFDSLGAGRALLLTGDLTAPSLVLAATPTGGGDSLDLTRTLTPIAATDGEIVGTTIAADRWLRAHSLALTLLTADLLGVMQAALDDAVAHASTRTQFGAPIGSFQAIQHTLADAAVEVEGARSCVWHAAWAVDDLAPDEALLAARTAKAYCSRAGVSVVEASVQVFGGLAITWEHSSHLRLRRVRLDRQVLGDEHVHHAAIAGTRLADHAGST